MASEMDGNPPDLGLSDKDVVRFVEFDRTMDEPVIRWLMPLLIRSAASLTADINDAEDLAQDAMIKVDLKRHQLQIRTVSGLKKWAEVILFRTYCTASARVRPITLGNEESSLTAAIDTINITDRQAKQSAAFWLDLQIELERLSPQDAADVKEFFAEDADTEKIAEQRDISGRTARRRKESVRDKVRLIFKRVSGGDSTQ